MSNERPKLRRSDPTTQASRRKRPQGPRLRALFIGRFQPFHKGHLQVIQKLLKNYREVIVVIGSAEQTMTLENPFTAGERIEMIRRCFSSAQLSRLILVPVRDINNHALWVSHLRSYLPGFHAVYSNNELVQILFKKSGVVVRKFDLIDRPVYQGKIIREQMLKNKSWRGAVPERVVQWIEQNDGVKRLQKLFISQH